MLGLDQGTEEVCSVVYLGAVRSLVANSAPTLTQLWNKLK